MSRRFALYRAFDATGRLLYGGCSVNPANRLGGHRINARWRLDAARIEIEHLPVGTTLVGAEEAERRAIVAEHPLHNVRHNRTTPTHLPQRLTPLDEFDPDDACTVQEAADLFDVSPRSLMTRIAVHKLIPARRIGGNLLVRLGDVQKLATGGPRATT